MGITSAWSSVQSRKVCGSQQRVTWDYPVLGSLLELCILSSLPPSPERQLSQKSDPWLLHASENEWQFSQHQKSFFFNSFICLSLCL